MKKIEAFKKISSNESRITVAEGEISATKENMITGKDYNGVSINIENNIPKRLNTVDKEVITIANLKQLNQNGLPIYPVTHEDGVIDNNGVSIGKKLKDHISNHPSGTSSNVVPSVTKTPLVNELFIFNSKAAEFTLASKDTSKITLDGNNFTCVTGASGGSVTATVTSSGIVILNVTSVGTRYYMIRTRINNVTQSSSWESTIKKFVYEVDVGDTIEIMLEDAATNWQGNFAGVGSNSLLWNSELGEVDLTSKGGSISVIDNLISTSTTDALSAKQGKELKGMIDNIPSPTTPKQLRFCGSWVSTSTYVNNLSYQDIVTNQGSSYICIKDAPIGTPISNTTYFNIIASKGVDGTIGPQGPQGPTSPPNPNATSVNGHKIWSGTQLEYDAITTKDNTTLYFITG